jgi:GTP pyrophosphokinase
VEVLTQEHHKPSRDWLSFVRTSRARNKIKHWIRGEQRAQARELGRRLLEKEAKRFRVELKKIAEKDWTAAAHEFGCQRLEDLYAGLGFGKYSTRAVLARVSPEPLPDRRTAKQKGVASGFRRTVERMFRVRDRGLSLKGQDLLMYRAGCCSPIPGEDVVGYITRGRGVAVHARHCPNVQNLLYDVERRIEVDWDQAEEGFYPVRLSIRATDRPGLLKEISGAIADLDCNIRSAEARSDRTAAHSVIDMIFTVSGQKKMARIITALRKLQGVQDVKRVMRV